PCRPVPPSGPSGPLETWRLSFRPPSPLRLVDDFTGFAGDTHFLAVAELTHANPGGFAGRGIHQHHVGQVNRSLALDDAALAELLRRALMLFDHVDAFDDDPTLVRDHPQHAPSLAALLARHNDYSVALPHVRDCHRRPQMTSDDFGGQ